MRIEIKCWITEKVLFAHECEGNNLRKTIEAAIAAGANLEYANLHGANLRFAKLTGAKLSGADLSWADFSYANLYLTDISGAILTHTIGNMAHIKSLFCDQYPVAYTADRLQIGCQNHKIPDWWVFSDKEILEMDGEDALKWWRIWKPVLQRIIKASPAVPTDVEE